MKRVAVDQVQSILGGAQGDRERLRAAEILTAMDKANIDALTALDKIERLDSGQTTENIGLMVSERMKDIALGISARNGVSADGR